MAKEVLAASRPESRSRVARGRPPRLARRLFCACCNCQTTAFAGCATIVSLPFCASPRAAGHGNGSARAAGAERTGGRAEYGAARFAFSFFRFPIGSDKCQMIIYDILVGNFGAAAAASGLFLLFRLRACAAESSRRRVAAAALPALPCLAIALPRLRLDCRSQRSSNERCWQALRSQ